MRQAFLAGLAFGSWPIVARLSGASAAWASFMVMVMSALVVVAVSPGEIVKMPSWTVLFVLVIAGTFNGAGMYFYGKCLDGSVGPASALMPVVYITMLAVTAVGGVLLLGETLTPTKGLGLLFGVLSIYFFSR